MKNFISVNGDETQEEKIKRVVLDNKLSIAAIFILSISSVFFKSYYESSVINNSKMSANAEFSMSVDGYSNADFDKLNEVGKYNTLGIVANSSKLDNARKIEILTSLRSSDKILNDFMREKVSAILISMGMQKEALSYMQNIEKKTPIIYSYLGDLYTNNKDIEKARDSYLRAKVLSLSPDFKKLMDTKVFSIDIVNIYVEGK
jgi:predicted negative regulator of RcsB-dependent stress response